MKKSTFRNKRIVYNKALDAIEIFQFARGEKRDQTVAGKSLLRLIRGG